MPRNVMDYTEVVKVGALLTAHCHRVDGTELCVFDEGWSDDRIAAEVGPSVTNDNVRKLRLKLIGKLQIKNDADLVQRLVTQHNALCDNLGASQFKVLG